MARVFLSPPHLNGDELSLVEEALASNWVAPLGPHVDAFEAEFAAAVEVPHAAAVSSGTAALHLALRLLGVAPGDEVLCSTLTFIGSASPILYQGARPVFVDASPDTWNMDPALLEEELRAGAARGRLPRAVVAVDLYGQSADYRALEGICTEYGVPLVEDAAEALGATYRGRPVGGFGSMGIFSFNGNKIITTSGGGMLVSGNGEQVARARSLASQARDPAPHYQHSELGFNYRLSNVLAAIGRAQLRRLAERVEARRAHFAAYASGLGDLPGIRFMPEADYGRSTRWLTALLIEPDAFGASREEVRRALEEQDIEARPVWKPMHLQPVFAGCRVRGGGVSERIFADGLCLPSGSNMEKAERDRVIEIVRASCRAK